MNVQPKYPKSERRIPLGCALMITGSVIIGFVLVLLYVSPLIQADDLSPVSSFEDNFLNKVSDLDTVITFFTVPTDEATMSSSSLVIPDIPVQTAGLPSFARADEAPTSYQQFSNSQPTRIVIPKLHVDAPVRSVTLIPHQQNGGNYYQWQVPEGYEVGWHENSASLGQRGNTVLNGHNNIYGEVFRDLIDLDLGDEITLFDADQLAYSYVVTRREVLPESGQSLSVRLLNARWIEPTQDERITLVSCWPYVTNSHRLVIVAEPVY